MESRDRSVDNRNSKWYEECSKGEKPCKHSKSDSEITALKDEAKGYLDAETNVFQLRESKSSNSEKVWLATALTQGTMSDKVAAAIVLIQDNPKYSLAKLVKLIGQVRIAKHNQCSMIIKSLKDLFLCDLLHPNFKLLRFKEQNLNQLDNFNSSDSANAIAIHPATRRKLMAHWYFEDQLCEQYERFITSLATIASDTVDANRELAISIMTDLLIGNLEQEHKLLELVVNKIGDPSSKVGSKVIFCLNKVLHEHPNMKLVMLKEVEKLLFRTNVTQRAQYYAICLLTQFRLNKSDEKIASTLIEVYLAFFKACLKKGEPDSRMMAAILTGVTRAYPFSKMDSNVLHNHINSLYKVVHIGSYNVSLNALNLLYHVTHKDAHQSNRFYSAFYRKLLDPQIGVANKRGLFFNLLFRALQNDNNVQRLYAFVRRSLQVATYFPANMICALLYVISKVLDKHKDLKTHLLRSQNFKEIDTEDCKTEKYSLSSERNNLYAHKSHLEESILLTNVKSDSDLNEENKCTSITEEEGKYGSNAQKDYDSFCRNPLYAGVTKGLPNELVTLSRYYHPSVSLFSNTILEGRSIDYSGDPLEDLSLVRFLDRYVFKNPKKLEDKKIQKRNDPLAQRTGYTPRGIRRIPVDSLSYLNEKEERIPVDELYLYRYLNRKREMKNHMKCEDDDVDSVNSDEFDDMLSKLTDGKDFADLDIAADIQTGVNKKASEQEDDDELEGEENSDESEMYDAENMDEEIATDDENENCSDFDLEGDDDDVSDLEFLDDDDENDNHQVDINKMAIYNQKRNEKIKRPKNIDDNIFVSAEKFAEMLEENSKRKGKVGGTDEFNTADGASFKQIEWEMKRHRQGSSNKNKRKGFKTLKKNLKKVKR